jgi:hypothetical protein
MDEEDMQNKTPVAPAGLQPKTFGSGYLHLTIHYTKWAFTFHDYYFTTIFQNKQMVLHKKKDF